NATQFENHNPSAVPISAFPEASNYYPDEQPLLQLRPSLQKPLQAERRRDMEEARRLDHAIVLDPSTAEHVARRLETMVTRYQDDEEFRPLIADAKKRLQSAVPAPTASGTETPPRKAPTKKPEKSAPKFPMWMIAAGAAAVLVVAAGIV